MHLISLRHTLAVVGMIACCLTTRRLFATDYFVTIGGGYSPSGNQASLEANIIFFQTVLKERHRGEPELFEMTGTLESFLEQQGPVMQEIVTGLSKQLGFVVQDDVSSVIDAYEKHRRERRAAGRGPRRRFVSGRRDLLEQLSEKWPDLGDAQSWHESPLLKSENQMALLAEIR